MKCTVVFCWRVFGWVCLLENGGLRGGSVYIERRNGMGGDFLKCRIIRWIG